MVQDFPNSQGVCTISFGIPKEEWNELASSDGNYDKTEYGPSHSFSFSPAHENDKGTEIMLSHDVLDMDVRLIAVNVAGKELEGGGYGGGDGRSFRQTRYVFSGTKRRDIREFRLQGREYLWADVRGVSLHPGQLSRPKIVVVGERVNRKRGQEQNSTDKTGTNQ